MAVKSSQLQNPERDFDLNTRGPKGEGEEPREGDKDWRGPYVPNKNAERKLADIRERIEAARTVKPDTPHCLDCYEKGRDAAIRAIEGVKAT